VLAVAEEEFKPVYTEYEFSGDLVPAHPTITA